MKLSVDINPRTGGDIQVNSTIPCSYPSARTFTKGSTVTIVAQAADGYKFIGWDGDVSSSDNPISLEIDSATYITANFSNIIHTLSVQVNGGGSTSLLAGSYSYAEGEEVEIIANPDSGWRFDSWNGEVADPASAMTTVLVDSDKTVSAVFTPIMHSLSIEVNGNGTTSPEAGTCSHAEGTELDITATPKAGWQFDGWSGEVADPTSTTTTILIDTEKTVSASFSQIMHNFSIEVNGDGATSPEAGSYSHAEGTMINITATPEDGWRFDGWSGEVTNPTSTTTTVLIDSDKTVSAVFSEVMPYAKLIGIIAGAVGAGLATLFATRRKKS